MRQPNVWVVAAIVAGCSHGGGGTPADEATVSDVSLPSEGTSTRSSGSASATPDLSSSDSASATPDPSSSGQGTSNAPEDTDSPPASATSTPETGTGSAASDVPTTDPPVTGAGLGLTIEGNRILLPNGEPFRGRGANLNDTRSCDACTYLDPDVAGLNRWTDELLDGWGANFVRFNLMAFADSGGWRQQWASLSEDPSYLTDIHDTVTHMTSKPGVYVMVTVFADPSIKDNNDDYDSEWPTAQTRPVYEALADVFSGDPKVLFGLTNEPHGPEDRNAELAQRYLDAIDAIRGVETAAGVAEHVVVVQAPQQWARYLDYFVQSPIPRSNVAYEVHAYNPESDFDHLLTQPAQTLPIIVGEYGPTNYSTEADIRALWQLCQELELPHLAWTFHQRCPPNLLQDTADDGCGFAESQGYDFPRTDWGNMLYDYLAQPW